MGVYIIGKLKNKCCKMIFCKFALSLTLFLVWASADSPDGAVSSSAMMEEEPPLPAESNEQPESEALLEESEEAQEDEEESEPSDEDASMLEEESTEEGEEEMSEEEDEHLDFAGQLLKDLDRDKDGKVNLLEFTEHYQVEDTQDEHSKGRAQDITSAFAKNDKDKDDKLDVHELEAADKDVLTNHGPVLGSEEPQVLEHDLPENVQ